MANKEHLAILKQGVDVWNRWRDEYPNIVPDLSLADLHNCTIPNINLVKANLRGAELGGGNLMDASLSYANLVDAHLSNAELIDAKLVASDLRGASLHGTDLSGANLSSALLNRASLISTNFINANLWDANLTSAYISGMVLSSAKIGLTIFGNNYLGGVIGLDSVQHLAPSTIGMDTLYRSVGLIPESFLRGCGLSDWQIQFANLHNNHLDRDEITLILYKIHDLRANQALQISSLFISYSHADSLFVDRMEQNLNKQGIRFWRDIYHSTAGRLEKQLDRAIRLNPTVLLILSANSVESDWVEHEVRTARSLEKELKRDIICPVALDDSWKESAWPDRLREQIMEYNILDFSGWSDNTYFERMYTRLIEGLHLFYE